MFVRENTEGEYAGTGGLVHDGHDYGLAVEVPVFTRQGIARVARYAFGIARERSGHLISVTKSNASLYNYVLWDRVVDEVGADFPDVRVERMLVDAMAARMVLRPDTIDVVVASNLFGDILTDLGAALQGSLGLGASGNINPDLVAVGFRARPRLGPRHRGPGTGQSAGRDLVGRDDAATPGRRVRCIPDRTSDGRRLPGRQASDRRPGWARFDDRGDRRGAVGPGDTGRRGVKS